MKAKLNSFLGVLPAVAFAFGSCTVPSVEARSSSLVEAEEGCSGIRACEAASRFGPRLTLQATADDPRCDVADTVGNPKWSRRGGRTCSAEYVDTDRLNEAFELASNAFVDELAVDHVFQSGFEPPGAIGIVFHLISGSDQPEEQVSDAQIRQQLDVLNLAFEPVGVAFEVAETIRHENSPFASDCHPDTPSGQQMKATLSSAPGRTMNVYVCQLWFPYIVGYASFPNSYPEDDPQHGVVIDRSVLPGGTGHPFNLGNTLVHEVGHYFGLLHTFAGGCSVTGDGILDTPSESGPAYGCPVGRDTCPEAGLDPVSNFMNYSDDACMDHFTPGQAQRMREMLQVFRPGLGQ